MKVKRYQTNHLFMCVGKLTQKEKIKENDRVVGEVGSRTFNMQILAFAFCPKFKNFG